MSFKIDYREYNEDTLSAYLSEIVKDAEKTEEEMLEEAAEKVKDLVVANLNKHRRMIAKRYKNRRAMADDVKITRSRHSMKISGDKMTGTLWHLVNDGNLHSQPTHFMDDALTKLDGSIDKIWDEIMR